MTTRIEVLAPPPKGTHDVLSREALAFLEMLHTRFNPTRHEVCFVRGHDCAVLSGSRMFWNPEA